MANRIGRYFEVPRDETEPATLPTEFLGTLWQRKWHLVGCLLACLALGGIYWAVAPRVYPVTARLLVERQGMPTDPEKEPASVEFLATQAEVIRSRTVLERVVKSLDLPPPDDPEFDPVVEMSENLVVKPVVGTNVLSITYNGSEQDLSLRTARSIIATYRSYLQETEQGSQVEMLRLVTQHEKELREELEALGRKYLEFRKESPLLGEGKDSAEVQRTKLVRLGEALVNAQLRRIDLENRLEALPRSGIGVLGAIFQPPAMLPSSASQAIGYPLMADTLTSEAKAIQPELLRARADERRLREVNGYGPNHPEVRRARETIAVFQKRLEEVEEAGRAAIRQELAAASIQERQLSDFYREEYTKAKAVDGYLVKEQQAVGAIQRVQGVHDLIVAQVKQMQLFDQSLAAGRLRVAVQVLGAPVAAEPTIFPPPPLLLAFCGLLGLAAGAGWITLLERMTTRIHSPEQVQGQLDVPVFACIPSIEFPRPAKAAYPGRQACQASPSPAADAFRILRTRLWARVPTGRGAVVQLASPIEGEGKTTIVANLAYSFAELGKRVLVVDGDLRGGVQHQVFDVPGDKGLASVLHDGLPIEEAIRRSPLAPIDVLPRGPVTNHPVDLLARPQLEDVFAQLRGVYDLVLLDGPPILAETGALLLAPQADGVLLSLRVGHSSLDDALRACEMLETLDKRPWGLVVSQVPFTRRSGSPVLLRSAATNGKAAGPALPATAETVT